MHDGNDGIVHDVAVEVHGVLERDHAWLLGRVAGPPTDALQRVAQPGRRPGRRGRDLRWLPQPFAPRRGRARRGRGGTVVPVEGQRIRGQAEPAEELSQGVGDRRRGQQLLARRRLQDVERERITGGRSRGERRRRLRDHVEGRRGGGGRGGGRGGSEQ